MTEPSGFGAATPPGRSRSYLLTPYAAGFITAFGAHAVAANLGRYATGRHTSLLELGVLLALYNGAEVVLKPAFGALADRAGARVVLIGGLVGFALASAAFVVAGDTDMLAVARLAQGSAAAAFSPAASALVAAAGLWWAKGSCLRRVPRRQGSGRRRDTWRTAICAGSSTSTRTSWPARAHDRQQARRYWVVTPDAVS